MRRIHDEWSFLAARLRQALSRANDITEMVEQFEKPLNPSGSAQTFLVSVALIVLGLLFGLAALALVSNQFGNTDSAGLILLGFAYGANDGPLFNSVAYFGGRYELTMQVPVTIESDTSVSMRGDPRFYLNEISAVTISPSGQVGASFSRNLEFGYEEWKRVYKADGDFSPIGFNVNPTPVADFQKYTDATRPSN